MTTMLPGMFEIVLTWIFLFGVCAGVGLLVLRVLFRRAPDLKTLLNAFWLGWALVLAFLQIWHLFLPVGKSALALVMGVGWLGVLLNVLPLWRALRLQAATLPGWMPKLLGIGMAGVLGVFMLWLSNKAMGPVTPSDAGLYHLNAIRWIKEYAVVPGLGNLHSRLGVLSSVFLFHAMVDALPWVYRSFNIVSGLLLSVAMAQIICSAFRVLAGMHKPWDLIRLFFLPLVVQHCFFSASSTSPDVPVFLLGMVVAVELYKCLGAPKGEATSDSWILGIVLLACVGITVKLSFVMLGLLASITVILHRAVSDSKGVLRVLIGAAVIAAVWILPWAAHNVITSGYPAYPSTVLGVPLEWSLPPTVGVNEARWIRSWCIQPGLPPDVVLADWSWLIPWMKEFLAYWVLEVDIPLILALMGFLGWLLGLGGCTPRERWARVLFVIVPFAALVFWFFAAPAPRFAGAAFWWLGGGAVVCALHTWRLEGRRTVGICLLTGVALLSGWFHYRLEKFSDPGPDRGFHPVPVAAMKTFETNYGLKLNVPATGDLCWDAALPCTRYLESLLRLRREGDLGAGFVIGERKGSAR